VCLKRGFREETMKMSAFEKKKLMRIFGTGTNEVARE
jgi:hypothetical protein